jgi:hypothetical protein
MKKIDKYIAEAIDNVRKDREITRRLLDDVMIYLSKSDERHREVGMTAAKYVETLQRSNEQLVKVASLVQKEEKKDTGLSEDDKADIFDMLQNGGDVD